jgi:hypothetical protein
MLQQSTEYNLKEWVGGECEEQKGCPLNPHYSLVGSKVMESLKDAGVQCFHDLLGMLAAPPINKEDNL